MSTQVLQSALRILLRRRNAGAPAQRLATRALVHKTLGLLSQCRFPGN